MRDFFERHTAVALLVTVAVIVIIPLAIAGGITLAFRAVAPVLGETGTAILCGFMVGLAFWGSLRAWTGKRVETFWTAAFVGLLTYALIQDEFWIQARVKELTERVEALEKAREAKGDVQEKR
jgi:hypothetical protein